jgi:hypothetical protein
MHQNLVTRFAIGVGEKGTTDVNLQTLPVAEREFPVRLDLQDEGFRPMHDVSKPACSAPGNENQRERQPKDPNVIA